VGGVCVVLAWIAALASSASAQNYPQELVGRPAPPLVVESVLDEGKAAPSPTIELKGSVTLLEFWFTTCGPCRAAVPHINNLVRKFGPKGLRAYAVTFDSADAVGKYLKEVPLAAPVAIDTSRSTMKAYKVFAYPTTVLIGKEGIVLACAGPNSFTDEVISDALAGKPVKVEARASEVAAPPEAPGTPTAIASVRISPDPSPSGASFSLTPERAAIKGVGLRQLLEAVYRLDPRQCEMQLLPDERLFDVEAAVPGGTGDAATALLRAAIVQTFHLEVRVEQRDAPVAVFRIKDGLKGVKPWNGKDRVVHGDEFKGMKLASLVYSVAPAMGLIGIDETHDDNFYDFVLTLDDARPMPEQVRALFGIEITKETRALPFTIIRQDR
jgi:uncharacterized protein (TIGR03435 family)